MEPIFALSLLTSTEKVGAFTKYLLVTQGWEASSVQTRIGISDKILVALRLEDGETRVDLILPNAWSEKD